MVQSLDSCNKFWSTTLSIICAHSPAQDEYVLPVHFGCFLSLAPHVASENTLDFLDFLLSDKGLCLPAPLY